MIRLRYVVLLGVWLAILPLLGIPGSWKSVLTFVTGVFLVIMPLAGIWRRPPRASGSSAVKTDTFVENGAASAGRVFSGSNRPSDDKSSP